MILFAWLVRNLERLIEELEYHDFGFGFQSKIEDFVIPVSGTWFAAVTTFDNTPLFDPNAIVSGWKDNGGSNPNAVPEPSTLALMSIGLLGVLGYTQRTVTLLEWPGVGERELSPAKSRREISCIRDKNRRNPKEFSCVGWGLEEY